MCGCQSVAAMSARRWKRARNWASADTEAGSTRKASWRSIRGCAVRYTVAVGAPPSWRTTV